MNDFSRSVPSVTSLLAESVRRYRAGFPGVARAFLPVFAVFAAGQIGLALWGEATTFGGLIARALFLAGLGLAEVVTQALAMGGIAGVGKELPRAEGGLIYRRGARVFWPLLWVSALAACALSVIPALALVVAPYLVDLVGVISPTFVGPSVEAAVQVALYVIAALGLLAAVASAALAAKLVHALPLVVTTGARGLAALEASAGLAEGRAWLVGGRLAAGFAATFASLAPFLLVLVATSQPGSVLGGASWAWTLFAAGYLLVAVPFATIFLTHLVDCLRDTPAERALARASGPWVRWFVWIGAAAWAILLLAKAFSY